MAHRDGYTAFVASGLGKKLATTLGLPQPVALRRHVPGRPLVDGPSTGAGAAETVRRWVMSGMNLMPNATTAAATSVQAMMARRPRRLSAAGGAG